MYFLREAIHIRGGDQNDLPISAKPASRRTRLRQWKGFAMVFMVGLTLSQQSTVSDAAPPTTTTSLTIDDFSRDRTLFDSGAALGLNEAQIPVSGTGTVGEMIEYRVLAGSGAPGAWNDLTVIDAGGTWSAEITTPRMAGWARVETRIKSEPVVRAITTNRFGVGHVVALCGQSEVVRLRSTVHDALTPASLLADDMVQALWLDPAPVVKHLTSADPHTSALAAMANVLIAERPGEKFALVFQAHEYDSGQVGKRPGFAQNLQCNLPG